MSQIDYLQEYQPPSPPRFKPMSLPFLEEISLQLDQSLEDENIGRCWDVSGGKSNKNVSKSSIMKFLGQKRKCRGKYMKEISE